MAFTIYHNPKCGTSRNVLAMLEERGIAPRVIEYLKTPPDRATLNALLKRMGIGPRDLLRRKGTPFDELGLDDPKWTDDQLVDFIVAHPILMERPVVDTGRKAVLCRPKERVLELLD
ncbi:MAG: arsenate reductase (glutaredoxin) [Alphaproteobacteria bacterium]